MYAEQVDRKKDTCTPRHSHICVYLGGFDVDEALVVDGATNGGVADALGHGHSLARHHALVDERATADNGAVAGHG